MERLIKLIDKLYLINKTPTYRLKRRYVGEVVLGAYFLITQEVITIRARKVSAVSMFLEENPFFYFI